MSPPADATTRADTGMYQTVRYIFDTRAGRDEGQIGATLVSKCRSRLIRVRSKRLVAAGAVLTAGLGARKCSRASICHHLRCVSTICFDGVELIGLAVLASLLPVRSIDLDHRHCQARQMTSHARPVGASALDPDTFDRAEPGHHTANILCPAAVVRNDSTPNKPPFMSTTAATFTSRCVWTPPTIRREESTMTIGHPFP